MIPKETLITWLHEHGQLTADMEFDIHESFDIALEAATSVSQNMPGIGFLSRKKRLDAFMSVCRKLDNLIAWGRIEPSEAVVALALLRAQNPTFRKAIAEFDSHVPDAQETLPLVAREYLEAQQMLFAPQVAG